ncbi:unnamed protein product [Citrullus colocynthis]|uniref:Uncharacterized protein n=1 Tax=Citrullus colocynthis TaxID=252529 RepID=A0ABP0YZU4_9ROSI
MRLDRSHIVKSHRGASRTTATSGSSDRQSYHCHALPLVVRAPLLAVVVYMSSLALALVGFLVVRVRWTDSRVFLGG